MEVLAKSSVAQQALRWDTWSDDDAKVQQLRRELTYEFCRMLRYNLAQLEVPTERKIDEYLKKVQVFLSHSKHDDEGAEIAKAIRLRIYQAMVWLRSSMSMTSRQAFTLMRFCFIMRVSAMVAIHTDSLSREWWPKRNHRSQDVERSPCDCQ